MLGGERLCIFFQFTTSRGGRHTVFRIHGRALNFQFTTSRGGRRYMYFINHLFPVLSIHDLTRRSTHHPYLEFYQPYPFNSRPHEEVDTVRLTFGYGPRFFQFTTSRGGRLLSACPQICTAWSFNSRPHEEVDMSCHVEVSCKEFFQFTTSRGGRHSVQSGKQVTVAFQFTTSRGGRHHST